MNLLLRRLLSDGPPSPARIAAFIAQNRFPLVDADGVTFVWHGEAERVALRCWVSGLPTAIELERIEGTPLWAYHMALPPGSRIEYKFEVDRDGRRELLLDPLNRVRAADPFGANSVCRGHGYRRPDWTRKQALRHHGSLDQLRVDSAALGDSRDIGLYIPPRFRRSRRYGLLVVHDGFDYLRYAALSTVLDNLIDRLEIEPLIVVLTQSPDRLHEYAGDPRHARFVAEEIPAAIAARLPLLDDPAHRGLMGASFGGVATLHAAWTYPGRYGRLLLQSGSFAFTDLGHHQRGPTFDPVVRFMNRFREAPGRPAERIYQSCGTYESLIYENRSLAPLLSAQGVDLRYEEARDGHNWENWRDRLRSGLSWLFPGPLWMVYE